MSQNFILMLLYDGVFSFFVQFVLGTAYFALSSVFMEHYPSLQLPHYFQIATCTRDPLYGSKQGRNHLYKHSS